MKLNRLTLWASFALTGMLVATEVRASGPPMVDTVTEDPVYGPLVGDAVARWARTAVVGTVSQGAVHTFVRGDNAAFAYDNTLVSNHAAPAFGASVAVWGDTVVVGAPGGAGSASPGEAHLFVRLDEGWFEQAVLLASDGVPGDAFGTAVAITGDTVIVGAPGADSIASSAGAAYVFTRSSGQWSQEAKLTVVDGQQGAELGASVAAYGNTVVVGAPYGDGQDAASGVAYVFHRGKFGWAVQAKLAAADGATGDRFGAAVGLQGDMAVVGAPNHGHAGSATLFSRTAGLWIDGGPLPTAAAVSSLGVAVAPWGGDVLVRGKGANGDAVYVRALSEMTTLTGLSCGSATTLASLATCIRDQMPRSGSDGFVPPKPYEQADFRTVVAAMLGGACDFALPSSLSDIMEIRTFVDSDNDKRYCLLMEVGDDDANGVVDKGWGTFIVDGDAERDLSMQAPHPLSDSTTEVEAIEIFKGTNARSYLMCGAHRNANSATNVCQSEYGEADCAHATATMYYAAVQEIEAFYGANEHVVAEWHGMAATTCPDVNAYISPGLSSTPPVGSPALALQANVELYNPTWNVEVPGTGACSLNATDNVSGRLLNDVAEGDVCTVGASASSGRFLHIEQQVDYRVPSSWIPAVNDTWPLIEVPEAPSSVAAVPGDGQVQIAWATVSGADEYRVWSSLVSGGPYSIIASGLTDPMMTHTGLTNGITYYYVVTAANVAGESVASVEVWATPTGVPAAPSGLMATPGKRQIALSWVGSMGATSYRVKRSNLSGGPYTTIADVTGTSYTNVGLPRGVTYYYVTTAINAVGESSPSNEASATSN